MISKRVTLGLSACAFVAALTLVQAATPAAAPLRGGYLEIVDQFASAPTDAVERLLALPPEELALSVRDAARTESGWTPEALDRALVMHGDALVTLARDRRDEAIQQLALTEELAAAAARHAGNQWFVHRWYSAYLPKLDAKDTAARWLQQPWYRAAAGVDRARELETLGGQRTLRPDLPTYEPAEFREAIPLLEQGVAAGLPVAALHLGRIRMLAGSDLAARQLLDVAANDPSSRVNRYLAHLFLGALAEGEDAQAAETHYRAALDLQPRAQSARLALSSFLVHDNRMDEARRVNATRRDAGGLRSVVVVLPRGGARSRDDAGGAAQRGVPMMRATMAMLAAAAMAGGMLQEPQRFRSGTEAVTVDVLVLDGGRTVGDLTAADFELLDSGVQQQVDNVQVLDVPFSMMLALDSSSSMQTGRRRLQDAARAAFETLHDDDRASVLSFSDQISAPTPWSSSRQAVLDAIDGLRSDGSTSLVDAAFTAVLQRDPEPGRRNLVILFTDGEDTSSWLPDDRALEAAERSEAVVYSVAIDKAGQRGGAR